MVIKMLKVVVAAILVILGGCSVLSAQEEPVSLSDKVKGAGGGGFMFGLTRIDLDDLNTRLQAKGFDEFKDDFTFYGGGGYGIVRDKIVIGGEGGGFFQDVISTNQKASLCGGYGFFNIGYLIFPRKNLRLFPLLGLGGGGLSLKIWERDIAPTFDEIIENPKREVSMATGGLLFNFALGADYLLILGENEEGEGGLLFGLRAGYIFSPSKADWQMEDVDVLGGPDVRINGPYLRLVFGGGGREK